MDFIPLFEEHTLENREEEEEPKLIEHSHSETLEEFQGVSEEVWAQIQGKKKRGEHNEL